MEVLTMILSGLALLAASVCLILHVREKKRNEKRNAAMLQYVDKKFEAFSRETASLIEEQQDDIRKDLKDLKDGVVPNYNEALAAKNAVDSFNQGLSGILGFDPMAAVRKQREKNQNGGEVD